MAPSSSASAAAARGWAACSPKPAWARVEEGKQIIEVNGVSYLLETALRADIALTRCRRADPLGNLPTAAAAATPPTR